MPSKPLISCIIPTYNRVDSLERALKSLVKQDIGASNYEIIVSDNNSNDHTKQVVERLAHKNKVLIKYHWEPKQGAHWARNSAFFLAKANILYYTDDDMIFTPSVLSSILKVFSLDSKIATVTGKVVPSWEEPPPVGLLNIVIMRILVCLNERKSL